MAFGYVKKISEKNGKGKRGPWTLYSGIFQDDKGNESGWVSFGFDRPPFVEGNYVEYSTKATERGLDLEFAKIVTAPVAPVKTASVAAAATQMPASNRDTAIQYQSSRKDAIQLVELLLANDALPMSEAKTKAGNAKRFEEVTAMVDKLTVQLFHDVQTLRLLSSVEDAGAVSEGEDVSNGEAGTEDNA